MKLKMPDHTSRFVSELMRENKQMHETLQKVEAYMASDESPIVSLWENGDICDYDENPCEYWNEVLAQLRDLNIPAECLGYGATWAALTIYREVWQALQLAPESEGTNETTR